MVVNGEREKFSDVDKALRDGHRLEIYRSGKRYSARIVDENGNSLGQGSCFNAGAAISVAEWNYSEADNVIEDERGENSLDKFVGTGRTVSAQLNGEDEVEMEARVHPGDHTVLRITGETFREAYDSFNQAEIPDETIQLLQ